MPAFLLSLLTALFLPSSSVSLSYFVLAVPMLECLGKLVHEFHISPSRTEWYLLFLTVQLQVHNVYSERKSRNTFALLNHTSILNSTRDYNIV